MLKIWFIKYALKACSRGSCYNCPYKNECFDNFTPEPWCELIKRFLYIKFNICIK